MEVSFLNIIKYYEGLPHQDQALKILQAELERTNPELLDERAEWIYLWKTPETANQPVVVDITITVESNTIEAKEQIIAAPAPSKTEVMLPIPYLSQLNNEQNPHGSCNVTCVAMCLAYFGHRPINSQGLQLEDELYRYCLENRLSRHSPHDLAKLLQIYGRQDIFEEKAKWADVKQWLIKGNPCIVHGWFTRSGHIITIVGFNSKGWIVHDPYGEWFSWGYDTSVSGKYLTYSYGMMQKLCGHDGDLWIHYVS